jgi:hypothetical protein
VVFEKLGLPDANTNNILQSEAFSRRQKSTTQDSTGLPIHLRSIEEARSADLVKIHDEFADFVWDNATAKTVFLLGKANYIKFNKRFPA